jgi:hypothetical protein
LNGLCVPTRIQNILDFLDEKLMEKKSSYLCRFHWQITGTKNPLRSNPPYSPDLAPSTKQYIIIRQSTLKIKKILQKIKAISRRKCSLSLSGFV